MNKAVGAVGWILTVVFVAAAAVLAVLYVDAIRRLVLLEDRAAAAESEQAAARTALAASTEEVRELKLQVAKLESGHTKNVEGAGTDAQGGLLGNLLSGLKSAGGISDGGPSGGVMSLVSKMFDGEDGAKMAEYSAGMAVDMAYAELLKGWNLPKDVEDQVRQILRKSMAEQIKTSMEAMKNKASNEEIRKMNEESRARLRKELSGVLNSEEMAQWEEYEDNVEAHVLDRQFDMQLGMMAPGLTPENRELAVGVLVEETVAGQESIGDVANIAEGIAATLGAFDRGRARIAESGQLDEAQMAEFDRFINMMKQQMEMAAAMFGGNPPVNPQTPVQK